MKSLVLVIALFASALANAQAPAQGSPAWRDAVLRAVTGSTDDVEVSANMQPLLQGRKPWHVSLVVDKADARTGTFCHGALIDPAWVLTSAACVCAADRLIAGFQVVVSPQTSLVPERRLDTVPGAVWLYQWSNLSPPQACFTAEDAAPIPVIETYPDGTTASLPDLIPMPTVADLALVKLKLPEGAADSDAAAKDRLRVIELLGADTRTWALLGEQLYGSDGVLRGGFAVESVITAGLTSQTLSKEKYSARADYVLETKAALASACAYGTVSVGSVAAGTTSFALCNNPGIGRTVSSLAGTPVILTDHKRPLMLGVYGAYDSNAGALKFTSVMETMPGTALPIAASFAEFFKNEMHMFWQPLRPRSASARGPIYVPASEEKIATFTKNLEAACTFRPWERFRGTDVFSDDAGTYEFRIDGSVKDGYTQQVSIDADGAPNAYHPADTGLDKLAHAGYPHGGWKNVLVADPSRPSVPYVQTTGKFAGYFVSQTGLRDATKKDTDPSKYVNSDTVPYIALPTQWYKKEGTGFLGDVVIVKSMLTGATSSAVIADTGGTAQTTLGEMSLELARRLGAKGASAITGPGVPMDVMVMVFRGSRFEPAWPVEPQDIDKAAVSSLEAAGGWPAPSCLTPSSP